MVSTPSLEADLKSRGFTSTMRRWSRGVDLELFQRRDKIPSDRIRPVMLYVGRVSAEKGLINFLQINRPGTKVVVGDGPAREELAKQFPEVRFLGYRKGPALAAEYSAADLFVFPSKTDTFGIVMIEALACGLPIAAYPVTGPLDIVTRPELGALDENLAVAIDRALQTGDPAACSLEARRYTWEHCTQQFISNLVPIRDCESGKDFQQGS